MTSKKSLSFLRRRFHRENTGQWTLAPVAASVRLWPHGRDRHKPARLSAAWCRSKTPSFFSCSSFSQYFLSGDHRSVCMVQNWEPILERIWNFDILNKIFFPNPIIYFDTPIRNRPICFDFPPRKGFRTESEPVTEGYRRNQQKTVVIFECSWSSSQLSPAYAKMVAAIFEVIN